MHSVRVRMLQWTKNKEGKLKFVTCILDTAALTFQILRLLYLPLGLTFKNSTWCSHYVYMFQNNEFVPYTHLSDRFLVTEVESWIKIDQLDVACFIILLFTAQHVSNVSASIFRRLRLTVDLFHVFYWSGSMCVDLTVRFGWGGVVSLSRLKHFSASACTTHIEPEQYNTWNKSTISRKLLKMDALTFEKCWAVNSEIIKQVTSSWSIFIQLSRWCTVQ